MGATMRRQHQIQTMRIPYLLIQAMLFSLTGSGVPAHAHNGAVALAAPVAGIPVDGDLTDWPEGMRRYAIALLGFGDPRLDEGDFSGSLCAWYIPAYQMRPWETLSRPASTALTRTKVAPSHV